MLLNGLERGGAMSCQSVISRKSSTLLGVIVLTRRPGIAGKAALSWGGGCTRRHALSGSLPYWCIGDRAGLFALQFVIVMGP